MAATKDDKVNRFLELVQAERGYTPPFSEWFVALPFETYGAAGEPTARLFQDLIATWARQHHACESEVAVFATSGAIASPRLCSSGTRS